MEENKVTPSITTYKSIIRKTGEEVEIIAFNQPNNGERSDEDWITYIDSKGEEHIKEHLNLQLDFKPCDMFDKLKSMWNTPTFNTKFPSSCNIRYYDIVKELVINHNYSLDSAKAKAKEIVDATKNEYEEKDNNEIINN